MKRADSIFQHVA